MSARLVGAQQLQFGLLANTCKSVVLDPGKSCSVVVVAAPQADGTFTAGVAFRDTFSDRPGPRTFVPRRPRPRHHRLPWGIDGEFVPVSPARILDTRLTASGQPAPVEPVRAGERRASST